MEAAIINFTTKDYANVLRNIFREYLIHFAIIDINTRSTKEDRQSHVLDSAPNSIFNNTLPAPKLSVLKSPFQVSSRLDDIGFLSSVKGLFLCTEDLHNEVISLINRIRAQETELPIFIVSSITIYPEHTKFSELNSYKVEFVGVSELTNRWTKKLIFKSIQEFSSTRSGQTLMNAIDSSGESIVVTDINGSVIYTNPAFSKITGFSAAEVIGKTPRLWRSLHHSHDFYEKMWSTILKGQKWVGEIINRRKSGDEYIAQLSISPIFNQSNHLLGFTAIHSDITEAKKNERELINARAQALALATTKLEFIANMSHELRTPLNSIWGTIELLRASSLNPVQNEYCSILQTASGRLLRTITDLIDLASIDKKELAISKVKFNIETETKKIISLFHSLAEEKNIHIKLDIDTDTPNQIEGDPARYGQILANYLSNAIKFSRNSPITVNLRILQSNSHQRLVIRVIDSGPGVKKSQQRKLFSRFSKMREDGTELNGSGLGLAVCKNLAELMGGTVGYEAQKPNGSVFWFTVPLGPETMDANLSSQSKRSENTAPVILIVEDDELSGQVLSTLLEKKGYQVALFNDPTKALKSSGIINSDLILMDCMLPNISGYECTQRLRQLGFNKPIIGMSANATLQNRDQCRLSGMNDFITKPIDFNDLEKTLSLWLDHDGQSFESPINKDVNTNSLEGIMYEHLKSLSDATSPSATQEMINLFLKNTPLKIENLDHAFENLNFETICQLSHQLKSSSGYLGLKKLQQLFERIEMVGTQKNFHQINALKIELHNEVAHAMSALKGYLNPRKDGYSHVSDFSY